VPTGVFNEFLINISGIIWSQLQCSQMNEMICSRMTKVASQIVAYKSSLNVAYKKCSVVYQKVRSYIGQRASVSLKNGVTNYTSFLEIERNPQSLNRVENTLHVDMTRKA
jgi:hypothetical protein